MWRGILFFLKLAVLVAAAVWLADNPGRVAFEWLGWRVETSMALLLAALLLLLAVVLLLHRLWRALRGVPRSLGRSLEAGRQERGRLALAQGMMALYAGDARGAERWSRKASELLEPQPMLRLLAAQSAQLSGDEAAARERFTAMLEEEETRLTALRGLTQLALSEGDEAAARRWLEQARALQPEAPWVLGNLFELSEKAGDLAAAEAALLESRRHGLLPAPEADRKRAVVIYERAEAALVAGDAETAETKAAEAARLQPDLLAATLLQARLLARRGRERRAATLLQEAWRRTPHPEIAEAWLALAPEMPPLEQVKRAARLVQGREEHRESRLLQARTALDAELWGEARRHLAPLLEESPPERRVCTLMAEVEEREHGAAAAARDWLQRAATAAPDPAWLCGTCGAVSPGWTPHCGACGTLDSLAWRTPPHLAPSVPALIEAVEPETVETEATSRGPAAA